jgi:hypothetical protein
MAPPGGRSNNIFGGYEEEKKITTTNGSVSQNESTLPAKQELTSHQLAAATKYHHTHGANIFGCDDERKVTGASNAARNVTISPAKPELTSHQIAAATKYHNVHGTDIFGTHEATNNVNNNKQTRNENTQNKIFGEVQQVVSSPPVIETPAETPVAVVAPAIKSKKRTGYNPITGQSYEDEDDEKEKIKQAHVSQTAVLSGQVAQSQNANTTTTNNYHSSSRVSQPPGGRSTKLW